MRKLISVVMVLITVLQAQAQRGTSSPYSIYGLGELVPFTNSVNGAMGGLQQAISTKNILNFSNPATLGGIAKHKPMLNLDMEGNYQYVPSLDSIRRQGYFRNFGMGMRLNDRYSTGFGISPYSFTGYYERELLDLSSGQQAELINTGSGSISKVYWSNAINLIVPKQYDRDVISDRLDSTGAVIGQDSSTVLVAQHLSFGVTASYLFGATKHLGRAQFPVASTSTSTKTELIDHWRGWQAELGLFYMSTTENNWMIQAGITASPTGALKHDQWSGVWSYTQSSGIDFNRDTLAQDTTYDIKESLPWGGGMGVTIGKSFKNGESLLAGIEMDYQAWTLANIDGYLQDRTIWRVGLEWNKQLRENQPQPWSFRLGGVLDNGYVLVDKQKVKQTGMTFGVGIPFIERGRLTQTNSRLNVGCEVGVRGDNAIGQVKENYGKVFVGLTLKPALVDGWFKKRKYD